MGLFPEFLKSFSDSVDGSLYRTFGTTAHLGNLHIAEIVQGIEQEALPLGVYNTVRALSFPVGLALK